MKITSILNNPLSSSPPTCGHFYHLNTKNKNSSFTRRKSAKPFIRAELTNIFSNDNIRTSIAVGASSLAFFGGTFFSSKSIKDDVKKLSEHTDTKFKEAQENTDSKFKEIKEDSDKKFKEVREDSDKKCREAREDSDKKFREPREDSDKKFKSTNDYINQRTNDIIDKIEKLEGKVDRNYESTINRFFTMKTQYQPPWGKRSNKQK